MGMDDWYDRPSRNCLLAEEVRGISIAGYASSAVAPAGGCETASRVQRPLWCKTGVAPRADAARNLPLGAPGRPTSPLKNTS